MKGMRRLILSFVFSLAAVAGISQTWPVQVNVYALPPYGSYLNDYYATTREKLVVTLLNRDLHRPELEVELQMSVSCSNGLKIQNRQGVYYPSVTLVEGVVTRLTQDDLAPYFQNITQQGYMSQGKLPDGLVEFSFSVIEKYTRKPVSVPASARVWLSSQKPPLLNLPSAGEHIAFREPLNIRFQWTPQHKNISQVEYEFELRELPAGGAAPQSAFLYSPVIYSERLHYTTLMYTTSMHPPLDPGKTYGWRVQAIAKDGVDELNMFENSGFSEMRFLILQTDCQPPAGCTATVKDRSAELSWTSGAGNAKYVVQWRSESAVSPEWAELSVSDTRATLKNLQRNTAYEYRVGGMCEQGGQAVFSEIGRIDMGSRDRSNCGVAPEIDLSNRDPLPELKVGDEVMIGGDFPMTVTRVTGGSAGVFSGEGRTPVNWVFESDWAVAFDQLEVNTDYRQIGGTVRALYDKNRGMTGDLDVFTEGGTTPDTRNGIVMPDLELDFAIPENPQFTYHEETGELTVYTADGQEAGTVQMPKNEGKTVFPVVVKDKDGNLYKVEDESGETAGDGATANGEEKQLKATYIGKQTDPLPRLDNVNIAADVATVTFSKGAGKFAFDTWQDYYGSVSVIESKKVYEHLACGDRRYDVPWKLLPEGESDVVEAKIEIRDKSLDPEKVIFSTPQGTVYKHVYDQKKQTYALTLVAGADGDVQEIYALNKLSGASYQTLGKLNVITCRRQTPRVALVSVNDYTADVRTVKNELDRIYNPVGVTWEVAADTFSYLADRDYFEKGSGLLKAYNE
ncbi:MAG: fibronectin type III domain-containing protein, partial [Bacteroidales bacterium]|nr:fibronectin type III domain-containing protein [Bacteroidales bacterium]